MPPRAPVIDLPYCGAAPVPGELMARWNGDPLLLAAFAAALLFWFRTPRTRRDTIYFLAGMVTLFVALISPLCALSSALFAARSAHHLLLVAIAAPLLALAGIGRGRGLSLGLAALLHILVFWAWHVPAFYTAALSSDLVYWAMQGSMLGSGLLFWAAALKGRDHPAMLVGLLIAMMAQMGLLGALLTFAPAPLYAEHFQATQPFGLTALEDQQLAGLVMWVVSLPLYLAATFAVLARRLRPGFAEARA